jgi:hypothetical protein
MGSKMFPFRNFGRKAEIGNESLSAGHSHQDRGTTSLNPQMCKTGGCRVPVMLQLNFTITNVILIRLGLDTNVRVGEG